MVARYWFNAPLSGAYELTEIFLASLIFLALPLTTARNRHVEVDLLDAAGCGLRASCAGHRPFERRRPCIFAWRLWDHATRLAEDRAVTDSLSIRLRPSAFWRPAPARSAPSPRPSTRSRP
ncbi:MAG: TRAP transporter small permease subunit [Alphaproteobacteria bacterium]|nr:TRAP transporter small permease subunit [Alphaproteobacteria bacterium]